MKLYKHIIIFILMLPLLSSLVNSSTWYNYDVWDSDVNSSKWSQNKEGICETVTVVTEDNNAIKIIQVCDGQYPYEYGSVYLQTNGTVDKLNLYNVSYVDANIKLYAYQVSNIGKCPASASLYVGDSLGNSVSIYQVTTTLDTCNGEGTNTSDYVLTKYNNTHIIVNSSGEVIGQDGIYDLSSLGVEWYIKLYVSQSTAVTVDTTTQIFVNNIGYGLCTSNDDCYIGGYCANNQVCVDDLPHGDICNLTYNYSANEFNNSCIHGECWKGSNATEYICNRRPINVSSPNNITDITCLNHSLLSWENNSALDPDNNSIYFNVKIGSDNGSSDFGTGTTSGYTISNTMNATALSDVQMYYWVLQTCDEYGYCADYNDSDWDSFNRTNCAPEPPTDLIPANESTSDLPTIFTWTTGYDTENGEDSDYDAKNDYFCIQTKLNYTDPCAESLSNQSKTIDEDNKISLDNPYIFENETYYFALRTDDGFLNSSWIIYRFNVTQTDINLDLAPGVTEILFYPDNSTSKQVEPECQNSTFGCIVLSNRRGYTLNISVSTNISYPINYREGDTNWNFNHNLTDGNMSLWNGDDVSISLYNRSVGDWALKVVY